MIELGEMLPEILAAAVMFSVGLMVSKKEPEKQDIGNQNPITHPRPVGPWYTSYHGIQLSCHSSNQDILVTMTCEGSELRLVTAWHFAASGGTARLRHRTGVGAPLGSATGRGLGLRSAPLWRMPCYAAARFFLRKKQKRFGWVDVDRAHRQD